MVAYIYRLQFNFYFSHQVTNKW